MKNTAKTPMVSVIMGIYDCEEYLGEAIDSIINQTYDNWEIIMCDDGSTDDTYNIAMGYKEKYPDKIIILKNEKNLGLNETLNRCLRHSNGEFIARMDGDDICGSDRFEKEVSFLINNPEMDIVSALMEYFDEVGVYGRCSAKEYPEKEDLIHGTPFCHAPCMVRKEAYDAVGGYSVDKKLLRAEDYHLWVKMYAKGFRGYNIQEALYQMRDDRDAFRRRKFRYRLNEAYVKLQAVKILKLSRLNYIYAVFPVLKGFIPSRLYMFLHKYRLNN